MSAMATTLDASWMLRARRSPVFVSRTPGGGLATSSGRISSAWGGGCERARTVADAHRLRLRRGVPRSLVLFQGRPLVSMSLFLPPGDVHDVAHDNRFHQAPPSEIISAVCLWETYTTGEWCTRISRTRGEFGSRACGDELGEGDGMVGAMEAGRRERRGAEPI